MKRFIILTLTFFVVLSFNYQSQGRTQNPDSTESISGNFAKQLPEFSLKDPRDKRFTKSSLNQNGIVFVVTAPILSDASTQRKWSQMLNDSKPNTKARLVFIEDMSPSMFKAQALKGMKKEYELGEKTIVLVDDKGILRKSLGVIEKKTAILVYDKNGKLIYAEEQGPSLERAKVIWNKLQNLES